MQNQLRILFLIGVYALASNVLAQETTISFDQDATSVPEATPEGASDCSADASDFCGPSLFFLNNSVEVTVNGDNDGGGDDSRIVWYDLSPSFRGGIGAAADDTNSGLDSADGQFDWIEVTFTSPVSLTHFWMNGDHTSLTSSVNFWVGDSGGAQYIAACTNSACSVTQDAAVVTGTRFAFSAASGTKFYLAGMSFGPAVADASDCKNQECELVTKLELPSNTNLAPSDTIGQLFPQIFDDPRSDPGTGRCIGHHGNPNNPTIYAPDLVDEEGNWTVLQSPNIIIPWWLCGSPQVALIRTSHNDFSILSGTVEHTLTSDLPPGPSSVYKCQDPLITPLMTSDLQKQTVFAWIPDDPFTDPTKVIEGRVLELTTGCINPARGKSRDLSILFAGLHIDFGIVDTEDVVQINDSYQWLLLEKAGNLRQEVQNAKGTVSGAIFKDLRNLSRVIETKIRQGACESARTKLSRFIALVGRSVFDDPDFNHQGALLSRSQNMEFTNDFKYCPFVK